MNIIFYNLLAMLLQLLEHHEDLFSHVIEALMWRQNGRKWADLGALLAACRPLRTALLVSRWKDMLDHRRKMQPILVDIVGRKRLHVIYTTGYSITLTYINNKPIAYSNGLMYYAPKHVPHIYNIQYASNHNSSLDQHYIRMHCRHLWVSSAICHSYEWIKELRNDFNFNVMYLTHKFIDTH
jgi:hypothetical protein